MPYQVLTGSKLPIKVFVSDLTEVESQALDQLRSTANLPWVEGVAAMPDVHYGKGATVGSVIVNNGAVSPSVVGVDIGCFSGDTKVVTLAGEKTLEELAASNEAVYVMSFDHAAKLIVPTIATAKLTRKNAPLIKVTLDSGDEIFCTEDHQFLKRNADYTQAIDLKPGDSLMPYRSTEDKDGYLYVKQPFFKEYKKRFPLTFIHRMSASAFIEKPLINDKVVVHHKDEDKHNNHPSNLEYLTASYHSSLHTQDHCHWQNEEFEKKRKEAIAYKASTPEGMAYFKAKSTNLISYVENRNAEFREAVKNNGIHGGKLLNDWNRTEEAKANSRRPKPYTCIFCGTKLKSNNFDGYHYTRKHRKEVHDYLTQQNHKVISVEHTDRIQDVYCLQVPNYNNFALAAGVFVHNCGMVSVLTPFKADQLGKSINLKDLRSEIEQVIPVGFTSNSKISKRVKEAHENIGEQSEAGKNFHVKSLEQLGSLGGGNHFVEICLDLQDRVWVMLHSGSRNIGKELAEFHLENAKGLMAETIRTYGEVVIPKDLAPLLVGTAGYKAYLEDLFWCQRYARANRDEMMTRVLSVLSQFVLGEDIGQKKMTLERVDCHHNYIEEMVIDGNLRLVTRKGAVSAKQGEMGIIPGSMGAKSFIVRGKGNADSFCSCSHGAGRRMSRGAAKRTFSIEDLEKQTAGVECRLDASVIDEIPSAYKDIEKVMKAQEDLVDIVAELKQIICIKG